MVKYLLSCFVWFNSFGDSTLHLLHFWVCVCVTTGVIFVLDVSRSVMGSCDYFSFYVVFLS